MGIFGLSHRTQEIVDFFRNFTVDVVGVGDVCSFAQMDVRKHGHPGWQVAPEAEQAPKTNQYTQAEHGKTEMSLLHFTLTNPGWKPTGENERYLAGVKEAKGRDLAPQRPLSPSTTCAISPTTSSPQGRTCQA